MSGFFFLCFFFAAALLALLAFQLRVVRLLLSLGASFFVLSISGSLASLASLACALVTTFSGTTFSDSDELGALAEGKTST